jgi:PAS domain S-box-containing protein
MSLENSPVTASVSEHYTTGVTAQSSAATPHEATPPTTEAHRLQLLTENIGWAAREEALRHALDQAQARADQLSEALQSNRDIGAAIGILMAQHRVTKEQAFDLLRRASQEKHLKLHNIALDVLDTGVLEFSPSTPQVKATPRPPELPRQTLAAPDDGQRRLRALIDAVPAMIGYWDRDLRNVLANRAYEDWFGMTSEHIRGLHIREVLGEHLYALNLPYLTGALAGETQHFDRTIVDAKGTTRYSQASYIPDFVHAGEVAGIFVLVVDVTARVLNEVRVGAEHLH